MNVEETKNLILSDDEFVLDEARRLRYLCGLKREIRYARKRHEEIHTESVAEHVYGMYVLSGYFLPLEDSEKKWDYNKIQQLITWHDADEIETGDIITHKKTDEDRENAKKALSQLFKKMPESLVTTAQTMLDEYEGQQTNEARFTKAIDKAEPLFECLDELTYKNIFQVNKFTKIDSNRAKESYVKDFPYIKRFCEVLTNHLEEQGFYWPEDVKI